MEYQLKVPVLRGSCIALTLNSGSRGSDHFLYEEAITSVAGRRELTFISVKTTPVLKFAYKPDLIQLGLCVFNVKILIIERRGL